MANVTAKQLSEVIGVNVEKLLDQLKTAGVEISSADDPISDEDKMKLLESLRSSHGKEESAGPKKVTLRRKSKSELRVAGTSGRNTTTKTINVEVRKKRTYVRRADIEAEEVKQQQEAEAAAEQETMLAQQEVEAAARQAEEAAQAEVEAQKAAAEEAARAEAEKKAYEKSLQEVEAAQKAIEQQRAEAEAAEAAEAAARAALEQAAAASAVATVAEKPGKHGKHEDKHTRYGRKELHVKESAHQPNRKQKFKKGQRQVHEITKQHQFEKPTAPVVRNVEIPEAITVAELGQRMAVKAGDVIKVLMQMGTMATINEILDRDTATLVVEEMGHNVVASASDDDFEKELLASAEQSGEEKVTRPPVVTIMGHVDHGKTSLLDYIRKSRVTSGEAGGITQHIGAYHVETDKGIITFLDTPGHAAFSAMRARGAQATDIVVLVVAADDGVMPQTKEAIQHAKAAGVPLVVAVNKIDKEDADPERVKNELAALEVIPEEWGGENIFVPVSAITGEGVDNLLDSILLQSEILELEAVAKGNAKGIVVEATLDKGRGPVATVLVQSGLLQQGQMLLAGTQFGRVRAMYDESASTIKSAGPSMPAVVLGLSGVPNAGDEVFVVENERKAREFAETRESKIRESKLADQQKAKLQGMFDAMAEGEVAEINLLVKADVQGSSEAIRESLQKLSTDEVRTKLVATGVGGINESDINLAAASDAIVVGFNVRADAAAKRVAGDYGIDIRYYSVIYNIIDDVKALMSGMLSPESQENIIGLAEVKDVFRSPKFGDVAGCIVVEGVVRKGQPIRVLRDNVVIYEGELESLRRFKDPVDEVRVGTECGIAVKNYTDVQPGDQIEVFERIEVARSID
ncbi:MAG: translation initiation factor IF-2 [Gammaproteobacteria bacterium]|jgi:translation initiation factor IF-2|nr:translation initiation factor IF-2 [Gammaproteobacteria bacterium]